MFAVAVFAAGVVAAISHRALQEPIRVTAYGDSTQADLGNPHGSSRRRWIIENRAVGGSSSAQLLAGTDGLNKPWAEEMATSRAEGVILNHGLNDEALTIDQYRDNLTQMATSAKLYGKWVILEQPNHIEPGGNIDVAKHEARIKTMKEVAEATGAMFCPQPAVPLLDHIHPTEEGYFLKSKQLARCIREVL